MCAVSSFLAAHDDVIKWKHFPRYWPFVRGIHRSPVNSPHKGQWRGTLVFSLICVWINGWVNNVQAGDLRRHRAHYDINSNVLERTPSLTLSTTEYMCTVSSFRTAYFQINRHYMFPMLCYGTDISTRMGTWWLPSSTTHLYFSQDYISYWRPTHWNVLYRRDMVLA